jgi:hypothetical protein
MGYVLRVEHDLDAFEKSRKATVGFAMSVVLAYRTTSAHMTNFYEVFKFGRFTKIYRQN